MAHGPNAAPGGTGKGARKAKKPGGTAQKSEERDDTLQAVILADAYQSRFHPFTLETPRCLLPLANIPLIEYTLEFLAMSGVSEVYVYCGAFTDEVEAKLLASKWYPSAHSTSPFTSLEVIRSTAKSVGDAMRDLDARDIITGDFLLVHGDLISNMTIDVALARHRSRKVQDKNAIMTLLLREAGMTHHRTKAHGIEPIFVIDPRKDRCIYYEEMHPLQDDRRMNLDPDLFKEHTELEIRTDLIDCSIDICTPDVLALWSESFDYEMPRRHFLHGVLKDFELNGKTIHTEVISNGYAARASTLSAYDSVSKDVLGRWTYPLVPDSNLLSDHAYKLDHRGQCKENGVIISSSCKVLRRNILGSQTSIGDGSTVTNSIIGRRCRIGKNVTISNAYIWDDVSIGDGTIIEKAIVANAAAIGKRCSIKAGALLSYHVKIADGVVVEEGARFSKLVPATSKAASDTSAQALQPDDDDEDGTSVLQNTMFYNLSELNISNESISTITSETSVDSASGPRSRLSSFTSIASEDSEGQDAGHGTASGSTTFHHDAVQGLLDCLKEDGDFDSAKLEFMGLRLSHDANDSQIRRAIAVAFSKRIAGLVEAEGWEASKAADKALSLNGAESFVREVGVGPEGVDGHGAVELLKWLQRDLKSREKGGIVLAALCQRLYTGEVVGEEGFLRWWTTAESEKNEEKEVTNMTKVRDKTAAFIEWLQNAEEESSGDDESD